MTTETSGRRLSLPVHASRFSVSASHSTVTIGFFGVAPTLPDGILEPVAVATVVMTVEEAEALAKLIPQLLAARAMAASGTKMTAQ
jgi:hypothetical protein